MPRILIVDDSPTIRKMVRASLRALESFDLNMPDMHGVDVLKFLRRHPGSRAVPVVVLTTRGDDSSRETAIAAGATQYMTKPFVPHMLLSAARELLGVASA
jgi:two-component system chemotaxis response regulator CheY